ncbi:hypothetical protein FHY29_002147 [Xanthomonas arboricola]|uniref:hypothetical protein n=1 Tax=Xanthomonas arboricola TaxID=56448 RepID=UPI000CEE7FF1|nr:hypothetical protein [Xanthomonas arboricola]PPU53244.1 hypothetical protein XarbCFBP6827_18065 [Xanthomonas arboricola]
MSIQQSAKLISNADQRVESLTKREEFAKAAMQGIVANLHNEYFFRRLSQHAEAHDMTLRQWIAQEAAKQGDALLAELEKQG